MDWYTLYELGRDGLDICLDGMDICLDGMYEYWLVYHASIFTP
jgi:hypothetical protein